MPTSGSRRRSSRSAWPISSPTGPLSSAAPRSPPDPAARRAAAERGARHGPAPRSGDLALVIGGPERLRRHQLVGRGAEAADGGGRAQSIEAGERRAAQRAEAQLLER